MQEAAKGRPAVGAGPHGDRRVAAEDVEAVRQEVEAHLVPLGHKVYGVVNYDHFVLDPEVQDDWAALVRELVDRHYISVARYTTSGFLRAKLGPEYEALIGTVRNVGYKAVRPARGRAAPPQEDGFDGGEDGRSEDIASLESETMSHSQ